MIKEKIGIPETETALLLLMSSFIKHIVILKQS